MILMRKGCFLLHLVDSCVLEEAFQGTGESMAEFPTL